MSSKFKVGQKVVPISWPDDDEWVPKGRGMTVRILKVVRLGQKIFYFVKGSDWPAEWRGPVRRWIKVFEEKNLLTLFQAEVAALKNKISGTKTRIHSCHAELKLLETEMEKSEASLKNRKGMLARVKKIQDKSFANVIEDLKEAEALLPKLKKQLAELLKKQSGRH